jgi:hypothetical protein
VALSNALTSAMVQQSGIIVHRGSCPGSSCHNLVGCKQEAQNLLAAQPQHPHCSRHGDCMFGCKAACSGGTDRAAVAMERLSQQGLDETTNGT